MAKRLLPFVLCLIQLACAHKEAAPQMEVVSPSPTARVLLDRESKYNRIIVKEDAAGIRTMTFGEDGAVQTAINTKQPETLVSSYTRGSMLGLTIVPNPERILVVGLGGGAIPTYLHRNFPSAQIDVVELDAAVVTAAEQFFGFKEDDQLHIFVGDGRKFIERSRDRYDLIFLDAYSADSVPYELTTKEFLTATRQHLRDNGAVVSNLWGSSINDLYPSMLMTYEACFPEVHVVRATPSENRIVIALASMTLFNQDALDSRARELDMKLRPNLVLEQMVKAGYERPGDMSGAAVLVDRRPEGH